jgi:predicted DNA-binding transcriptional regulator AlpA
MKIETHRHNGKKVAQELGISECTLIRWAKDPQFPQPLRITSHTVRYDLDAVKQYLSAKAA